VCPNTAGRSGKNATTSGNLATIRAEAAPATMRQKTQSGDNTTGQPYGRRPPGAVKYSV